MRARLLSQVSGIQSVDLNSKIFIDCKCEFAFHSVPSAHYVHFVGTIGKSNMSQGEKTV